MALKSRFCAKCGKITKELIRNLCVDCYLDEHPIKIPRSLSIRTCPKCSAVLWKGIWIRTKKVPEYYLNKILAKKIKPPRDAELVSTEIIETGKNGQCRVVLQILDETAEIEIPIVIKLEKFACPECSRQKSDWLSKVQIRGKAYDALIPFVRKYTSKLVKTEQQRDGIDFFFFDKSSGNKLANTLRKNFKLSIKKTYEQHGHDFDTGRPRHREIILLR